MGSPGSLHCCSIAGDTRTGRGRTSPTAGRAGTVPASSTGTGSAAALGTFLHTFPPPSRRAVLRVHSRNASLSPRTAHRTVVQCQQGPHAVPVRDDPGANCPACTSAVPRLLPARRVTDDALRAGPERRHGRRGARFSGTSGLGVPRLRFPPPPRAPSPRTARPYRGCLSPAHCHPSPEPTRRDSSWGPSALIGTDEAVSMRHCGWERWHCWGGGSC